MLIDEIKNLESTQSKESVVIDGVNYEGWQIAKPLNYTKDYMDIFTRFKDALRVFRCQAIAVKFFSDLTEQEKIDYVNALKDAYCNGGGDPPQVASQATGAFGQADEA